MISRFGKRVLAANLLCAGIGALEVFGYYKVIKEAALGNFENTQLKEKPNLSQPVLIVHQDSKFVFAHRGGKTAVDAIMKDTFDNNKMIARAVVLQSLICLSISIGHAKSRMFIIPISIFGVICSICYSFPIFSSAVHLFKLSLLVREGNSEVWENLNEARYVQRLDEIFAPRYYYSRLLGMYGGLGIITYCAPFLGVLTFLVGKSLSLHKKLQ